MRWALFTVATLLSIIFAVAAGFVGIAPIYVDTLGRYLHLPSWAASVVAGAIYFGPPFLLASVLTTIAAVAAIGRSRGTMVAIATPVAVVAYPLSQALFVSFLKAAFRVGMHDSASHILLATFVDCFLP